MDITTGDTELTSSPWVNPGDSDSHEAALLLHWLTVSRMLLQPYARALASTVLTFPEPQGSFSVCCSSPNMVLVEWQKKERCTVFSAVTFLPLALRQRTHRNAIQFSRYCG